MGRKRIVVFRAGLLKQKWAFRFIASNGEILCQSETYNRKSAAIATASQLARDFAFVRIEVEG